MVEPLSNGHVEENINSVVLSFVERLTMSSLSLNAIGEDIL